MPIIDDSSDPFEEGLLKGRQQLKDLFEKQALLVLSDIVKKAVENEEHPFHREIKAIMTAKNDGLSDKERTLKASDLILRKEKLRLGLDITEECSFSDTFSDGGVPVAAYFYNLIHKIP